MWNEDDEDDEYAAWWWVAAGLAELLVERAGTAREAQERAARDLAALLLYHTSLKHRCRPGMVQLATLQQLLSRTDLPTLLRKSTARPEHHQARACLDGGVDLAAGGQVLTGIVAGALAERPGATPVENLWPAGTLLRRGGGGPTW